ncbi:MAG: transporter substrate-binding domain-containing protein [Chloroflexota bacterium]|nr:transporter substrate-binding domain-containing protein [Chloroflexota bacterium]
MRSIRFLAISGVVLLLASCAGPAATPSPAPTPAPTATAAPTVAPTATPTTAPTVAPTPTAVADACASPATKNTGRLTLSTDIPAFPPWWGGDASQQYDTEPADGSPWSSTDFSAEPYSMDGFEGATAYAIAAAMGFTPDTVDWVANPVFEQAYAPGPKPFDFHMAQISIRPERAQAVTFSDPYFDSNQSLLALTPNAITSAKTLADLKAFKFGAAANTTSLQLITDVIQPTADPTTYNSNADALTALQNGLVDGIIVDLSTAFYMRDAELENFDTPDPEGTIVGQFGPPATPDEVGAVLELGNPLVTCVNQAIAQIKSDGTLQGILDEWINTGQDVPFFE